MFTLRVAIPAMDEPEYLPATLDALARQLTTFPFEVYVCVNQPDNYWHDPVKSSICEHNQQTLAFLYDYAFLTLHILDFSSPGKGWIGKKKGVGFARKILFDRILSDSQPEDIVVSMDADTYVKPSYLQSIADRFASDDRLNAVAVPYYHALGEDEVRNRAMLRYELYMRNYAINLLKINSPYGFTALGSAIAMRASALRKIGNITPLQSGEDFYLVQKFCKMGGLGIFNTECVYPAGRYSDRVPFGTGPAMAMGAKGVWDSYPIYHHSCFSQISEAYRNLPALYRNNVISEENAFLRFLQKDEKKKDIWTDIRQNVSDYDHFVKAFHQKADGLRILQYVRTVNRQKPINEEVALYENLWEWTPEQCPIWLAPDRSLPSYSVKQINILRDTLYEVEMFLRKHYH